MPVPARDVRGSARRLGAWVDEAVRDVIDLAWPSTCLGCGAWGEPWCTACHHGVSVDPFVVHPRHAADLPVSVAAVFEGPLRTAVTAFKDKGRSDGIALFVTLARAALAGALIDVAASDPSADAGGRLVLVPVPSSPAAYRERGRFPLGEISQAVCARSALLDGSRVLVHRGRGVKDQSHVTLAQRRGNVADAFELPSRTARRLRTADARVVLVDDVVTTGATLAAAHATLVAGGVHPIATVALAATPFTRGG